MSDDKKTDLQALQTLLDQIEKYEHEMGLDDHGAEIVRAEVARIREQMAQETIDQHGIKGALGRIEHTLEQAAENIIASGALAWIARFG